MGFIMEFLREFGLFIVYIAVAVLGVFAGRAVRNRKDAKRAAEQADQD
ncbi:MAG: vanadium nitrogenase [Lachnospiraceae bacterium]|nr:vanadium nitrogenase [Lachnospiraceae bacterium]